MFQKLMEVSDGEQLAARIGATVAGGDLRAEAE
jgi:hypothetical protein